MQPTLAIIAPAPGMIFINGRFSGESSPDAPLLAPVHAFGAIYLEYRPLEPGFFPLARRIVLSGGSVLPGSLPEDVFAVRWPGGVTEVELSPEEHCRETAESLTLEGISCRIVRGEACRIEVNGLSCAYPRTGRTPELYRPGGCAALMVETDSGRCILTFSPDMARQTGFIQADRLEFESDAVLRAVNSRRDVAGHGTLERWKIDPSGLHLMSAESVWFDGVPHAPVSPEETALAAVQAALLGLYDEAEEHLSPALRTQHPLDAIRSTGSLCLPMKYGLPGGKPCVGLMQVENGSCAVVHPVFYRAEPAGSRWLLTELQPDNSARLQ